MKPYRVLTQCKVCGSKKLTNVLSLGRQYLSPTFVKNNRKNKLSDIKVPMTLVLCECGLLQLQEMVHPDLLYRQYFYRTATSGIMRRDLKNFVDDVVSHGILKKNDIVIDIGANDGTMLSYFPASTKRIGVEPAQNIKWGHVDPSIAIINDYFSFSSVAPTLEGKQAKVITATAMFYDLDKPNAFVADIRNTLHSDGLFCVQLSYLALMITNMNFYDICNEHLSYYSLRTLEKLFARHGLMVIDASTNNVNGGSIRVFVAHADTKAFARNTKNLDQFYAFENSLNLSDPKTYELFYRRMTELGHIIKNVITAAGREGKKVIGLGASTKGNVLLQFFGIDKTILPVISERNPAKVGLRTLGTDILLISEKEARDMHPAYMLVLPWYFKDEIVAREKEYLNSGGGLIFPMPYPHIVTQNGEYLLK